MELNNKIKQWISKEVEALQNIPLDGSIERAVEEIYSVQKAGGKVIVSGVGKAGQIGMKFATTLCSTGIPAVFLHPTDAQHGDLGIIQKKDVLFLISNSGFTREIVELASLAIRLYSDIRSIVLTGKKESLLAEKGDIVIYTGKTAEICPHGLTPTTSTTVMNVINDIIVVALMEKSGFSKENYALRHHSGYLGAKSREEI